jgi:hypothetical protein
MAGGELLLINPRKRRGKRRGSRGRKRNPVRALRRRSLKRSYRRRRSNPSFRSMTRGLVPQIIGAAQGAGGAILTDAAFTYIPLPAMLKTGPLGIVSRALMAFGVGMLSRFVVGANMAGRFVEGALTVQAYGVLRPMLGGVIPLAGDEIEGMGYYSPGMILQDDLSPLPDLNAGTPLQAYISGDGGEDNGVYDSSIGAYIS